MTEAKLYEVHELMQELDAAYPLDEELTWSSLVTALHKVNVSAVSFIKAPAMLDNPEVKAKHLAEGLEERFEEVSVLAKHLLVERDRDAAEQFYSEASELLRQVRLIADTHFPTSPTSRNEA